VRVRVARQPAVRLSPPGGAFARAEHTWEETP
jgi:hypothetical protein